ncbi:MAG: helix-turn-helix domain-containing protein [Candidatus Bathyarchaeota archaeon]|jgi:DNA-binding CsgD family transcriptional regulator|nr:helix-turn-helix domain-containing protein [Candidatus Bathyarchaeota archaeon]
MDTSKPSFARAVAQYRMPRGGQASEHIFKDPSESSGFTKENFTPALSSCSFSSSGIIRLSIAPKGLNIRGVSALECQQVINEKGIMLRRTSLETRILLKTSRRQSEGKEIAIYEHPERLRPILHRLAWKILLTISGEAKYPLQIAKELRIHEQKVYYHIRKLAEARAIRKVREEKRKGATAKYYKASFPAFGVELPFGVQKRKIAARVVVDRKLQQFLSPILEDGVFNGRIVAGSPEPHGPFKTIARDGHYAAYLTFFLGQFSELPSEFPIKLDVDVKAEKDERDNLISVGGPGTNLLTQEVNRYLPTRFDMAPSTRGFLFGGLVSRKTANVYTRDTIGLIAKIRNPWDESKRIIILAGNKAVGTKACVLAITKFWKRGLKNYSKDDDFSTVVQGFDLDGDGKVDSIEVLE